MYKSYERELFILRGKKELYCIDPDVNCKPQLNQPAMNPAEQVLLVRYFLPNEKK